MPHGRQDLSSPTRDRTSTPCSGSAHFNHWNAREVPRKHLYLCTWENFTAWLRCKLCLLMTYGQTFLSVMAPVDIWAPIFPGQQEMLQRWTDQSWIIDKEGRGKSTESESHSLVSDSLRPHGLYSPRNSPGQNTGVGSLSLLQGIFPTQGSNPGLLHCRWILYQLSHKASLRILERVAYPFPSGSSWPRNRMGVCCIAGIFPTNWAIREAQKEEEDDSSFPLFLHALGTPPGEQLKSPENQDLAKLSQKLHPQVLRQMAWSRCSGSLLLITPFGTNCLMSALAQIASILRTVSASLPVFKV